MAAWPSVCVRASAVTRRPDLMSATCWPLAELARLPHRPAERVSGANNNHQREARAAAERWEPSAGRPGGDSALCASLAACGKERERSHWPTMAH